jgi:cytochrome P450
VRLTLTRSLCYSDTTASTLTYAFYHLAKDNTLVGKLRAELNPMRRSDGQFNVKDLQLAEFLNGIVNETLRLHPPVPSGVLRLTPPEGIMIGKTFIPGNTTVATPNYTIGRRKHKIFGFLDSTADKFCAKWKAVMINL